MNLLKLTENNDWEGGTWNFFFWSNEENENKLREELAALVLEISEQYSFDTKAYSVSEVKSLLLRNTDGNGYMAPYQFLGILDMSKFKKDLDPFYKGGIKKYCQAGELFETENLQ